MSDLVDEVTGLCKACRGFGLVEISVRLGDPPRTVPCGWCGGRSKDKQAEREILLNRRRELVKEECLLNGHSWRLDKRIVTPNGIFAEPGNMQARCENCRAAAILSISHYKEAEDGTYLEVMIPSLTLLARAKS